MGKHEKKRGFFNDSAARLQRGWTWGYWGGGREWDGESPFYPFNTGRVLKLEGIKLLHRNAVCRDCRGATNVRRRVYRAPTALWMS